MEAEVRPVESVTAPSGVANTNTNSMDTLYSSLSNYPFATDQEYQSGLASILGHPETPATPLELSTKQDLVLRAQCFYYSRKFNTPSINPASYKTWLLSREQSAPLSQGQTPIEEPNAQLESQPPTATSTSTIPIPPTTTAPEPEQPPYPTSFAAIVDLITNNKPIPGIQEIPTTVLDLGSSKRDNATRRRKPWEKDTDDASPVLSNTAAESSANTSQPQPQPSSEPTTTTPTTASNTATIETEPPTVEKPKKQTQGVVHILKPNAIPDSGLIAKD